MVPRGPLASSMGAQLELMRTRAPITIRPWLRIIGRQKVRVLAPTWSQSRSHSRAPSLDLSHTGADFSRANHREAFSRSVTRGPRRLLRSWPWRSSRLYVAPYAVVPHGPDQDVVGAVVEYPDLRRTDG